MEINNSLLSLIGNTPMLKLSSVDTGVCELYVKLGIAKIQEVQLKTESACQSLSKQKNLEI